MAKCGQKGCKDIGMCQNNMNNLFYDVKPNKDLMITHMPLK